MPRGIHISERENLGTREIAVGDLISVDLSETPTTGYRWAIDRIDPPMLELAQSDFIAGEHLPGSGGTRLFHFRAVARGQVTLALKLWRDWEGESSIVQRFKVIVNIRV